MPFALALNRQTLFALLVSIAFVSVLSIDFLYKKIRHERRSPPLLIGHFNQGQLHDVSSIYEETQGDGAEVTDVLRELRRDGYPTRLLSKATDPTRGQAPAVSGKNHSSQAGDGVLLVPRVVHYVFMGTDIRFTLVNYLSVLSVERFVKPAQVFVHGDVVPKGRWWSMAVRDVKNLYHVKRPYMDTAPNGKPLRYYAHASDYIRVDILMRYGGIYLDWDVLVLKSFDPLLKYRTVLGRESSFGICNGIIVACKGAPLIRMMLEQYRSYQGLEEEWAVKSVENLHRLVAMYPHLVHLEETSLNRPSWLERVLLYHHQYDWSRNYAVHLFVGGWPEVMRPTSLEDLMLLDSTMGEMTRAIVYGADRSNPNVSISTSRQQRIGLLLSL